MLEFTFNLVILLVWGGMDWWHRGEVFQLYLALRGNWCKHIHGSLRHNLKQQVFVRPQPLFAFLFCIYLWHWRVALLHVAVFWHSLWALLRLKSERLAYKLLTLLIWTEIILRKLSLPDLRTTVLQQWQCWPQRRHSHDSHQVVKGPYKNKKTDRMH